MSPLAATPVDICAILHRIYKQYRLFSCKKHRLIEMENNKKPDIGEILKSTVCLLYNKNWKQYQNASFSNFNS